MRRTTLFLCRIAVALSTVLCGTAVAQQPTANQATVAADELEQGFRDPSDAYKPHAWWHWMNGHVTREAITRDLEDMKRIGLGGFTV